MIWNAYNMRSMRYPLKQNFDSRCGFVAYKILNLRSMSSIKCSVNFIEFYKTLNLKNKTQLRRHYSIQVHSNTSSHDYINPNDYLLSPVLEQNKK